MCARHTCTLGTCTACIHTFVPLCMLRIGVCAHVRMHVCVRALRPARMHSCTHRTQWPISMRSALRRMYHSQPAGLARFVRTRIHACTQHTQRMHTRRQARAGMHAWHELHWSVHMSMHMSIDMSIYTCPCTNPHTCLHTCRYTCPWCMRHGLDWWQHPHITRLHLSIHMSLHMSTRIRMRMRM